MMDTLIPTLVIDDTPIKRRGVCEFVEDTPHLRLLAQTGDAASTLRFIEQISNEQVENPGLADWLVLSDLRLGNDNGVELGRSLLEIAPDLRVVIYTQDPSWTLAAEVFRREYTRRGTPRRTNKRGDK
jgi:DNA-binding NarL/FixJ family response regulator